MVLEPYERVRYVAKYLNAYGLPTYNFFQGSRDAFHCKGRMFVVRTAIIDFTTQQSISISTLTICTYNSHYDRPKAPDGYIFYNGNNDHMIACPASSEKYWISEGGYLCCPKERLVNMPVLVKKLQDIGNEND